MHRTLVSTTGITQVGYHEDSDVHGTLELEFESGHGKVLVYQSQFAGTNKATAATWPVADVEREVADLKSRGVAFEHYDIPGVTRRGDVHITGDTKAAWFKDSEGNIMALIQALPS